MNMLIEITQMVFWMTIGYLSFASYIGYLKSRYGDMFTWKTKNGFSRVFEEVVTILAVIGGPFTMITISVACPRSLFSEPINIFKKH